MNTYRYDREGDPGELSEHNSNLCPGPEHYVHDQYGTWSMVPIKGEHGEVQMGIGGVLNLIASVVLWKFTLHLLVTWGQKGSTNIHQYYAFANFRPV